MEKWYVHALAFLREDLLDLLANLLEHISLAPVILVNPVSDKSFYIIFVVGGLDFQMWSQV